MKIVSIVGARPQFIKCSVLSREIRKSHEEILIHTGQHYDREMDSVFFEKLRIPEPDYYLEVGSGSHAYQTGEMLRKIEPIVTKERPDLTLVFGDTNSTLAGALAAVKLGICIGHVEAGLRSFDNTMPEEVNRIVADHCAGLLFCPTSTSVENLKKERITHGVYLTGDVMLDTLLENKEIAEQSEILEDLKLESKQYLVATVHRAGNTDDKRALENIVDALCRLDEKVVFPLHPRTLKALKNYRLYDKLDREITLTGPLDYLQFLKLMGHAKRILTDSGGVQKEAYILKIPCVTLRENTEWVETVEDGWNVLVGNNVEEIIRMARGFEPYREQENVFGQNACKKICTAISDYFSGKSRGYVRY